VVAALVAASASAIVPPKNCGTLTVNHHAYNIKADQLPCRDAKTYARNFIAHRRTPHGYHCNRYRGSALIAKCVNTKANPDRTIFVIKR